ncbi:TIGR04197 family type VII secretion effector [Bacillus cereus group sp. BceL300]|uniref:TIGR04197 family type VII secretion effector n=1 Tax=Bacillus cereus group TaxID=86661 RepID=UPI002ABFEB57|nr:TIGR04197 family type VII secretion effector [Bacillus cereus]MDZ4520756.1 TIGR04197 family type VII secretion effector [Bacillus cereus]
MGEIKLNKGVFDAKVSDLKSGASDLGKTKFNGMQLHRTNLNKLKKYCEAIEKLSKKVQQYEQILQKDISRIQQTGQEMVQQDEKLGKDLKDSSAHRAM